MKLFSIRLLLNLISRSWAEFFPLKSSLLQLNFPIRQAKDGFTIMESVLTLVIIATSLTAIFSLQTKLMRGVFGTHDIIEHLIAVRNFVTKDAQEEYYKQERVFEKKDEDGYYSISYEPKSSKQFPALAHYKNIVVEKFKLSSKSVFINHDEFVFFRFNPEGKK